jgi:hypothetical protein
MMMVWQLLQVGHLQQTPLILVGKMWPPLIEWARGAMLSSSPPLASEKDFGIPRCAAGADEAVALLKSHHAAWKARNPRTT